MSNLRKANVSKLLGPVFLLVLVLVVPSVLWADSAPADKETVLSKKNLAQAPRSPEELLLVIKEFIGNPEINGYEFGEKITGIPRSLWSELGTYSGKFGSFQMKERTIFNTVSDAYEIEPEAVSEAVYTCNLSVGERVGAENPDELADLNIVFGNHEPPPTPAITREILGNPVWIYIVPPYSSVGDDRFVVRYDYYFDKYSLTIYYAEDRSLNMGDMPYDEREKQLAHLRKIIEPFDGHKYLKAISLQLGLLGTKDKKRWRRLQKKAEKLNRKN